MQKSPCRSEHNIHQRDQSWAQTRPSQSTHSSVHTSMSGISISLSQSATAVHHNSAKHRRRGGGNQRQKHCAFATSPTHANWHPLLCKAAPFFYLALWYDSIQLLLTPSSPGRKRRGMDNATNCFHACLSCSQIGGHGGRVPKGISLFCRLQRTCAW